MWVLIVHKYIPIVRLFTPTISAVHPAVNIGFRVVLLLGTIAIPGVQHPTIYKSMLLDHLHATAGGVSNDVAQMFDQVMFTRQSPDHNGYYGWHIRMYVWLFRRSRA